MPARRFPVVRFVEATSACLGRRQRRRRRLLAHVGGCLFGVLVARIIAGSAARQPAAAVT
jgi:hypothetical protein